MLMLRKRTSAICVAMLAMALAGLVFAGSASATLTKEFTRFQFCPWTNPEVEKCTYGTTTGGEVVLGSKTVPIVNPVTLQGGYTEAAFEGPETSFAKFVEPTNGVTLSKTSQPVPGGLLGLVPPESSPPLIKALVELAAKNGLTKVNTTLELARPASEIRISDLHLAEGIGTALILPVKFHLENAFLGKSCYVGSSESPVYWNLSTGKTSPPEPNKPITGAIGKIEFLEEGQVLEAQGTTLVDNAWEAPGATGCAEALSSIVDPIINLSAGLPSKAGLNTAILVNTLFAATSGAVNRNDEENP